MTTLLAREAAEALAPVVGRDLARREAEWLLTGVLGRRPLDGGDDPTPEETETFRRLLARRRSGEPLAYCLGEADFCGIPLEVTSDVLIPRPETEGLALRAADFLRARGGSARRVLDLGTGSGALAVALALWFPEAEIVATDLSPAALAVASRNLRRHKLEGRVRLVEADLWPASHEAGFDLIVGNLPYVAEDDPLPSDVRDYEPALALFGGPDGCAILRRAIAGAPERLAPGGTLLLEVGEDAPARLERPPLARAYDACVYDFHQDLAGRCRYLEIRWS